MAHQQEPCRFNAGRLGQIEGLTISLEGKQAAAYFGGLPYALPPIGEYRFRAPRKLPLHYRYGTAVNPGRFTGGTGICPQPPSRNPPDPSLLDEDCLQLNIWIPMGEVPEGGWPVFFYLHGGFLQWGSANWKPHSLALLLSDSAFRAIMVLPAYRLNSFGFLAGKELAAEASGFGEPVGNMGLWDQRMALEWTRDNISVFGGNAGNITVAGYSAGGFSAFQQLAHELYHVPAAESIIKRVAMLSNGPGTRPKTPTEHQKQFDEYVAKLGISLELEDKAKLAQLRAMPFQQLIDVQKNMEISEFRVLSDGTFYPQDLTTHINSGDFAARMKSRNIALLSGECKDEHTIYANWRTPQSSANAVCTRLCAEYPEEIACRVMNHYCGGPARTLPSSYKDWRTFFGKVYADLQVHCLERGFQNALFEGGLQPGKDVLRYRFERRLQCVDETIPVEWGVTHSSDVPTWFWGLDSSTGITQEEKVMLREWNEGFAAFVRGDVVSWGPSRPEEMRRWKPDGTTDIWEDELWEHGLRVWDIITKDKA